MNKEFKNKEFKTKKGLRIFTYVFSVLFIILGFIGLYGAFAEPNNFVLSVVLALGMAALGGYCFKATWSQKIVITPLAIIKHKTFGIKQLYFSEIKGIKADARNLVIVSNVKDKRNMWVPEIWAYKDHELLTAILRRYVADLNQLNYQQELNQIVADTSIGVTSEQRLYNLNKAKKTANVLNIAGIVLALWLYFYPQPYQL